jgi:predicted transcriptional regulator of viral defense system
LLARFELPVEGLNISQTIVLLDPQKKPRGGYDRQWRVRVNMSEKELFGWRET